jgi:hypothetical protein
MRIWIDIPSVTHPGYVHPAGTEGRIIFAEGSRQRGFELDAIGEDGTVAWTERFLLPAALRVDPRKPPIILPEPSGPAQPLKPPIRTRPVGRR